MTAIYYWQQLSKRLFIKTALSHLLLGVIAAGFSFSQPIAMPIQTAVSPVGIIAIAAIVQDHQTVNKRSPQSLSQAKIHYFSSQIILPIYDEISPSKVIRLSPYNGIRAGPVISA